MTPQIQAAQKRLKPDRLCCGTILGILTYFPRKTMNTNVGYLYLIHNLHSGRVEKLENLGESDFTQFTLENLVKLEN